MRKVFFLYLISYGAFAQNTKFLVGINGAGVWNSYLLATKSDPYLFQGRINWNIGICSKYSLNKRFQADARLDFASKNFGSGVDFTFLQMIDPNDPVFASSGQIHWSVRQLYLEIPISLNYFFSTDKPVNFFSSLGFINSVLVSSKYSSGHSIFGSGEVGERYKDYLLSIKTGLGILFPMGGGFCGSAEGYTKYLSRKSLQRILHSRQPISTRFRFFSFEKNWRGKDNT
jgi:hypothetical protein